MAKLKKYLLLFLVVLVVFCGCAFVNPSRVSAQSVSLTRVVLLTPEKVAPPPVDCWKELQDPSWWTPAHSQAYLDQCASQVFKDPKLILAVVGFLLDHWDILMEIGGDLMDFFLGLLGLI